MPYCIAGDLPDCSRLNYTALGIPRDAVYFRNAKNINVMDGTVAQSIDRQAKTVSVVNTETGATQVLPYDKLILAVGGQHIVPPLEGIKLNRIFRLGHPDDAIAIRDLVVSGAAKSAVIIGGGLIGLETTEAFVRRGVKVSIVEMLPHVLPKLLDPESAAFLTNYLCSKGVEVRTGERVLRILGDAEGDVTAVVTDKGEIPADMVLLAIGVRANVQLAREAGLAVGPTGGIVVDEHMRDERSRHLRRGRLRGEHQPGQRAARRTRPWAPRPTSRGGSSRTTSPASRIASPVSPGRPC